MDRTLNTSATVEGRSGRATPLSPTSINHALICRLSDELRKWMKESLFQDPEDFVFYTPIRELPYFDNSSVNRALYDRMKAIGISDDERTDRNIVFHSPRHSFNTRLRNKGILDFLI